MIDMRRLRELVKLMGENDLAELDLRDQQETVTIKRATSGQPVVTHGPTAATSGAAAAGAGEGGADVGEESGPGEGGGDAASEEGLIAIESPMVGTFYAAPSPDADAFVSSGVSVDPSSVVCIIEAMKVFNEIKAEMSGTVERVLVQNGAAVEYGQRLFLVRPA